MTLETDIIVDLSLIEVPAFVFVAG